MSFSPKGETAMQKKGLTEALAPISVFLGTVQCLCYATASVCTQEKDQQGTNNRLFDFVNNFGAPFCLNTRQAAGV